ARVGGHAAQNRGHCAHGAVERFVVGLVVPDRVVEIDVLLAVRGVVLLAPAPGILAANRVAAAIEIDGALRADGVFGNVAPASVLVPALAEKDGAVLVGVLHDVVVEDFAVILALAGLATA